HPHSLRDPTPIADFIEQSITPLPTTRPAYLSGRITKNWFYGGQSIYREFPREGTFVACRGPQFAECYERYSFELSGVEGAITVIEPKHAAAGSPWVYRADFVSRDALVDVALLAKGF